MSHTKKGGDKRMINKYCFKKVFKFGVNRLKVLGILHILKNMHINVFSAFEVIIRFMKS